MNRVEFTKKICLLIEDMEAAGEFPILDYTKRSDAEQKRLFDLGLSRCDGVTKISKHQLGLAADIYFQDEYDRDKDGITKELIEPAYGWKFWHMKWEKYHGGKPMIEWDKGHFEG